MKLFSNFILLVIFSFFFHKSDVIAQDIVYTCESPSFSYLEKFLGVWEVQTRDRTSPGVYETNEGNSIFFNSIQGCGIQESFRGTYRGKAYAREVIITGKDSTGIEMVTLDSEHSSFSTLSGSLTEEQIIVYWYRDKEVKRLQSKYILTIEDQDNFEFSSYLSTDHGKTWALTHERKYRRSEVSSQ